MVLQTENLSHKYGASWAIKDINIEIAEPGIIGLLGSNGAGKSTTMNIICGAITPTEGRVLINGADIRKHPEEAKKNIGFLPQNPPVYSDFTVEEYLSYTSELRLIPDNRIKEAVDDAMEKTGIAHFRKRLIKNLSGGFRQRVGISQAIIHKPKMVVMDEPTNGLDPNQLIEARKLIREIAQERTVLLSSHVLTEMQLLCERIIMIESGRVIFSDSTEAFQNYIKPQSLLVRFMNPPSSETLCQIEGITEATFITDNQARLKFEGGEEITELIMETGFQQGWHIREINLDKGMLDDVFKHLSNKSNQ